MKIEKIVYEKDNNNIFNKCIVYYEDGTSEVTNNVLEKIFDFMDQEGLNIENVMKSPKVINGKVNGSERNVVINENVQNSNNHKVNVEPTVVDNTKEKNGKRKFIKITSIASIIVIAGALASHYLNKNKSVTFTRNKSKVEQSVDNPDIFIVATPKPTNTPKPIVTQAPVVIEKNEVKDEEYNETFRENVSETIEHVDPLSRNVERLNSGDKLSEQELLETINGINRLCQANMAEVEKLIEGGMMSGDKIFPLFDEMFPKGTIEHEIISNFTSRRNMLVDDAYNQDRALTVSDVNDYNDFFLDFVFGDVTFEHNGKRYGYYDISPISRYIVFMLGQTTLETNHEYTKDINGNLCDFNTIIGELEENYDLITSQLFSNAKVK